MNRSPGRLLKFYLRLMRHPGTPESIGRGVAAGLFIAFLIPGGHMLTAFFLAALVRGARGAAVLVTWITNPLTIPFIWPVQCWLGGFLTGHPLLYARIRQMLSTVIHDPSVQTMRTLSGELIISFFAGGLLLGSSAAFIGYFCTTGMVKRHRERKAARKKVRISRWEKKEF